MIWRTYAAIGLWLFCDNVRANAEQLLRIEHQGVQRTATLYEPLRAGRAAPLLIALHGLNQTTESVRNWLNLEPTSDREGFRIVYPNAVDGQWSYGRPINQPMPQIEGQTVDDVGFLARLMDQLVREGLADPERIYVTGLSRGGLMAFTLACALADKIAGVAPLITGMTEYQRDDCKPARPVPLMAVAGTADRLQAFSGGIGARGRLLSVPETMNFWRMLYGCTRREERKLPHRDVRDPTEVMLVQWSRCEHGTQLQLYRVVGGGHRVPSLRPNPEAQTDEYGLRNADIETADEIWAFFIRTSR